MRLSSVAGDEIVTHALGSCLGIAIHDASARVGGILHVMLPTGEIDPEKARVNPWMFVDTGVPRFFLEAYALGADKRRLTVKVAGGANVQTGVEDRFAIGKRNYMMLRKLFWKNGILIKAEDVGGVTPRTLHLEVGAGRLLLSSGGVEREL
jgi:chemotaxis protein CheD